MLLLLLLLFGMASYHCPMSVLGATTSVVFSRRPFSLRSIGAEAGADPDLEPDTSCLMGSRAAAEAEPQASRLTGSSGGADACASAAVAAEEAEETKGMEKGRARTRAVHTAVLPMPISSQTKPPRTWQRVEEARVRGKATPAWRLAGGAAHAAFPADERQVVGALELQGEGQALLLVRAQPHVGAQAGGLGRLDRVHRLNGAQQLIGAEQHGALPRGGGRGRSLLLLRGVGRTPGLGRGARGLPALQTVLCHAVLVPFGARGNRRIADVAVAVWARLVALVLIGRFEGLHGAVLAGVWKVLERIFPGPADVLQLVVQVVGTGSLQRHLSGRRDLDSVGLGIGLALAERGGALRVVVLGHARVHGE